MVVGIEKINLYTPRLYANAVEIAQQQGKDPKVILDEIMLNNRAVMPAFEDTVTLAVNAARPLLADLDLSLIELVIVGTESGLDYGKAVSTWVHRYLGLGANCRNFEVKQACYSATAALKMAAMWVAAQVRPGKKALVISADYTRPTAELGFEYVGGGCAVAMVVSDQPDILELDLAKSGYWTSEVADVFRPTADSEIGDSELSLASYLDALEGAFDHYEQIIGQEVDYSSQFKKHIYHAPFPGLTFQAHRTLLNRFEIFKREAVRASFEEKVLSGLCIPREIGTAYGASNFVCLMSLLHYDQNLAAGDEISFYAYGSGCQAEFYSARLGLTALENVRSLRLDVQLESRLELDQHQLAQNEKLRQSLIAQPTYDPYRGFSGDIYGYVYQDKNLLTLEKVENHLRYYQWS